MEGKLHMEQICRRPSLKEKKSSPRKTQREEGPPDDLAPRTIPPPDSYLDSEQAFKGMDMLYRHEVRLYSHEGFTN